jgi:hypothetical protein
MQIAVQAQIESLIVETYYVSDSFDATDTLGGGLEEGSVTYRIYLDLTEGCSLMKIYGDEDHMIRIGSTEKFFNNAIRGKSFGYEISQTNLKLNTVALDTWITMGLSTNKHFGIPKSEDPDTSIVGGKYNDGGSEHIAGGLLVNSDPVAGTPLTVTDGLVLSTVSISGIVNYGIKNVLTGNDSTIFGDPANKGRLVSNNMGLIYNNGITGPTPDNKILLAQLTTRGEISFKLNVEVAVPDEFGTKIIKYVAEDTLLDDETVFSKWLSYPPDCGCTDPNYLEYRSDVTCDDGSCQTPVIFGCTDPLACNFDPDANKNLPELCCYDSQCALDLNIVCPGVIYGCTDPAALNYNPDANAASEYDTCCYVAGCTNSLYKEYNPQACYDDGSCKVLLVPGCLTKTACNYNPVANVHVEDSCIYGGTECDEFLTVDSKDILAAWFIDKNTESADCLVRLFPNPVSDQLTFLIEVDHESTVSLELMDMNGRVIWRDFPRAISLPYSGLLDMSHFSSGSYLFNVYNNNRRVSLSLIKN